MFPDTLLRAMADASQDIGDRESWVLRSSPHRASTMSHLTGYLLSYMIPGLYPRKARTRVRALGIRILALVPAEDRLGILIGLSQRDERVIEDLFSGQLPERYQAHRYNILASLAIFAHYGLMREVFTGARLREVQAAMNRVQKAAPAHETGET